MGKGQEVFRKGISWIGVKMGDIGLWVETPFESNLVNLTIYPDFFWGDFITSLLLRSPSFGVGHVENTHGSVTD